MKIKVEKKILSGNDLVAEEIRNLLQLRKIFTINVVSSPGSGKTALLEKTISALGTSCRIALVAGDVQTDNDAKRLKAAGGTMVRPIITNGLCHLEASMVKRAISEFDLANIDLLVIENVGNLVCPSSYDLGEDMKVVLISTTEGDDKPLKYPGMFRRSKVMVINKMDLIGTSDFDVERVKANARHIRPDLDIFETSCRTGDGLDRWFAFLRGQMEKKKAS